MLASPPACSDALFEKVYNELFVDVFERLKISEGDVFVGLGAVLFTSPHSMTGQTSLIKRASEVPPLVLYDGVTPTTVSTARPRLSERCASAFIKGSAVQFRSRV